MPKKTKRSGAARTGSTTTKMTKAGYIRSQPEGMPAKDLIAKAKNEGIKLTEDTIYKTRSQDRKKAKKSPSTRKTVKAGASNGVAPVGRGKAPDIKNRVLSLAHAHPDWIAEKIASEAGCSKNYVYAVWGKSGTMRETRAKGAGANGGSTIIHSDHRRALRNIVVHIGLDRAKELMEDVVRELTG